MSSDVMAASFQKAFLIRLGLCFDLLERFSCFCQRIRRIPSSRRDPRARRLGFLVLGPAVRFVGRVGYDRGKLVRRVLGLLEPLGRKRRCPRPFNADALLPQPCAFASIRTSPPQLARCLRIASATAHCRDVGTDPRPSCRGTRTSFPASRHHSVKARGDHFPKRGPNAAGSRSRFVWIPCQNAGREIPSATAHCPSRPRLSTRRREKPRTSSPAPTPARRSTVPDQGTAQKNISALDKLRRRKRRPSPCAHVLTPKTRDATAT